MYAYAHVSTYVCIYIRINLYTNVCTYILIRINVYTYGKWSFSRDMTYFQGSPVLFDCTHVIILSSPRLWHGSSGSGLDKLTISILTHSQHHVSPLSVHHIHRRRDPHRAHLLFEDVSTNETCWSHWWGNPAHTHRSIGLSQPIPVKDCFDGEITSQIT